MPEIVSKSQFAALIKVSRSRLSQIVKTGKIFGDAIVGSGQHARIRVATAIEQLRNSIDGSVGNARLQLGGPNGATQAASDTSIETDIKKERLAQLALSNDRARAEAAAASGRFTSTADATRQMGRIASRLLNIFEGWLGHVAVKLAAHFGLAQRDVLHVLRAEFRLFRASASSELRREAADLPILVEDEAAPAGDEGHADADGLDVGVNMAEQPAKPAR